MKREKENRPLQEMLPFENTWGGRREGAGRKPAKGKRAVPHDKREEFWPGYPVLVTLKLAAGLPSLRTLEAYTVVRGAIARSARRNGMRICHYSVQSNHVHLIVEVDECGALRAGMQGLSIRIARGLNRAWGRDGKVFAERFHHLVLLNPSMVRNALAYVYLNHRRHGIDYGPDEIDGFSSGDWFDVWVDYRPKGRDCIGPDCPVVPAETWLLMEGWLPWGLLAAWEVPGRRSAKRCRAVARGRASR